MLPLLVALALAPQAARDSSVHIARGTVIALRSNVEAIEVQVRSGDSVSFRGGSALASPASAAATPGGPQLIVTAQTRSGTPGDTPLVVAIPAWAQVTIVTTTGNITVSGVVPALVARTSAGNIRMEDGGGNAMLHSLSGNVTVSRFQGSSLSVDAPAGNINVYTAFGTVEANSVNGSIALRAILSPHVTARTVNGQIQIDGPFASNGEYALESHNGAITIFAPADFSASIISTTFMGTMIDEYSSRRGNRLVGGGRGSMATRTGSAPPPAMTARAMGVPREQRLTFGSGETHFVLNSFDGVITIRNAAGQ